ncbi:hypothetical protein HKX48_005446 [Thoreauomyces humboldtii]|nr:hypothetical protein HKX48_005446 [Thoreauomyces humboldtii]
MPSGYLTCAVVTVSDRVSAGEAADVSGPAICSQLTAAGWTILHQSVVPDEVDRIREVVLKLADNDRVALVVTTGGTGFAPRDVTPEAIMGLLDRQAPGLSMSMLVTSLEKTPMAALSRGISGLRGRTLIITLPGSPRGSTENLAAILDILPHAVELACGDVASADMTHRTLDAISDIPTSVTFSDGDAHRHRHHHHPHEHRHHHGHHLHASPQPHTQPKHANHAASGNSTYVSQRARTSPYPLVSYADAVAMVLEQAYAMPAQNRPLTSASGYILGADIRANDDVPAFRASIVDGYAVIHTDGPGTYPVAATSTAGSGARQPLGTGNIARITTGAPLPPGATAVVMVEDTTLVAACPDGIEEAFVAINASIRPGENIREPASDVRAGTIILTRGSMITAAEIGLLASVGVHNVSVYAKPAVAVLASGNELCDVGVQPLPYGSVRDSNTPMLTAALTEAGFAPALCVASIDGAEELATAIRTALTSADVLISTGGVSMGELDLLKPVLEKQLGATIHFGRVMLKPGKPTTFATLLHQGRRKLLFALPGNPASVAVTFSLFVLPALRAMAGHAAPRLPTLTVELADSVHPDPSRPEFHRAHVSIVPTVKDLPAEGSGTRLLAFSTGSQRSSRLLSMRGANVILAIEPGSLVLASLVAALAVCPSVMAEKAKRAAPTSLQIGVKLHVPAEECTIKSASGDTLSMHYTGTLYETGEKFDSSVDRGQPFEFTVGAGQVIKGWDQGLLGMCVGEKRKLTIPSHLGYGDRGSGAKIPGGSTLVFETELLAIKNRRSEL